MAAMLPSSLEFPPFDTDEDPSSIPQRWEDWLHSLETMLLAMAITDHARKWALLLHYAGRKVQTVEKQLTYDKSEAYDPGGADHFRRLKEALNNHFAPAENIAYATHIFHSLKQDEGEPIDSYATRLREQAKRCKFCNADCMSRNIRDQIVVGCRSQRIRRKALSDDLALDNLLKVAHAEESANAHAADIEKSDHVKADSSVDTFKISKQPGRYSNRAKTSTMSAAAPQGKRCFNCGGNWPHPKEKPCPARGKLCSKCNSQGHFAACCRGGPGNRRNVYTTASLEEDPDEPSYMGLGRVALIGGISLKPQLVDVNVNNSPIAFNPDTGADVTIIDPEIFNGMAPKPSLKPSGVKVAPYGTSRPLPLKGTFRADLTLGSKKYRESVYVAQNPCRGISLLSREASKALGLVTIHIPGTIGKVSVFPPEGVLTHPLLSKFDDICHGMGCHANLKISLPLKEGAQPSIAPPSRIPVNLFKKVKEELERLKEQGVFESVPVDDNSQFVSRMVPVPKKIEGSDELGVRITMDWRNLNKSLDPVHHEVPTVEQLKHDLNGAQLFSQIDLRDAFYQLPLDDESKRLTTFSTPWGLHRSTRLVQGATPSASICHETLRRALQGITNALNIYDNIIVWGCGSTDEEVQKSHDTALRTVFEMFRHNKLTINRKKCIFNATTTKFFGFIFSADGISPDPEKTKALREAAPPTSSEEVRSFLGMTGLNAQFIENYATITEPLRRLTQKGVEFKWGLEQQNAFEALKVAISDKASLSYFDISKPTALITDASPVGVNATLAQINEDGSFQTVNIASRALTETEQKYNQLEREAVAMHFGCLHFKQFLIGTSFKHYIDPQPLKCMMDNPKKDAPARIERVRMKLQSFRSEICMIKGKDNPADYLSRHPLPYHTCSKEEQSDYADVENFVFTISRMLPEAITSARVIKETASDPVLSKLLTLLLAGHMAPPREGDLDLLKPYFPIWQELSTAGGMVLKGEKIVLPESLIEDAIKIAHEGHMGIQRTKHYLRSSMWFPRLDSRVEQEV